MLEMLKNRVGSAVVRSSAGTAEEPAPGLSNFRTPGLTQAGKVETLTPFRSCSAESFHVGIAQSFLFLGTISQTLISYLPLLVLPDGDSNMAAS